MVRHSQSDDHVVYATLILLEEETEDGYLKVDHEDLELDSLKGKSKEMDAHRYRQMLREYLGSERIKSYSQLQCILRALANQFVSFHESSYIQANRMKLFGNQDFATLRSRVVKGLIASFLDFCAPVIDIDKLKSQSR